MLLQRASYGAGVTLRGLWNSRARHRVYSSLSTRITRERFALAVPDFDFRKEHRQLNKSCDFHEILRVFSCWIESWKMRNNRRFSWFFSNRNFFLVETQQIECAEHEYDNHFLVRSPVAALTQCGFTRHLMARSQPLQSVTNPSSFYISQVYFFMLRWAQFAWSKEKAPWAICQNWLVFTQCGSALLKIRIYINTRLKRKKKNECWPSKHCEISNTKTVRE